MLLDGLDDYRLHMRAEEDSIVSRRAVFKVVQLAFQITVSLLFTVREIVKPSKNNQTRRITCLARDSQPSKPWLSLSHARDKRRRTNRRRAARCRSLINSNRIFNNDIMPSWAITQPAHQQSINLTQEIQIRSTNTPPQTLRQLLT